MSSLIFVHGTGVRKPPFDRTFGEVKQRALGAFGATAVECYWGGKHGTRLNGDGASIPLYDVTMGPEPEPDADALEIALWRMLYDDPLYELRLFAAAPAVGGGFDPGSLPPLGAMNDALAALALHGLALDDAVRVRIDGCRLDGTWDSALEFVRSSQPYTQALTIAGAVSGELRGAIAKAVVAEAVNLYMTSADDAGAQDAGPDIPFDGRRRDALCEAIVARLGGETMSKPSDWVMGQLRGVALRFATGAVERRRGAISASASLAAGDVMQYQVRGGAMRDFIRDTIVQAAAPRIVLAHSLGGIACVDMFVEKPIDGVEALITVGSQAPYLYELDALYSLRWKKPLPAHFPRWINAYDLRDFLSYVGGKVFAGRVVDIQVDNRQPFPESHGAYWTNDDFWSRAKRAFEYP